MAVNEVGHRNCIKVTQLAIAARVDAPSTALVNQTKIEDDDEDEDDSPQSHPFIAGQTKSR